MSKKNKEFHIKETATKFKLLQLMRLMGNLRFQISGEGKVMFKEHDSNGNDQFFTHRAITFSGDQGCLFPLDSESKECCFSALLRSLASIELWTLNNDENYSHYITDDLKEWFRNKVPTILNNLFKTEESLVETSVIEYFPAGSEKDPLVVITVALETNDGVIDFDEELEEITYVGEIKHVKRSEPGGYLLTVKPKRGKEESLELDEDDDTVALVPIEEGKHLYMEGVNSVITPILLHSKKRPFIAYSHQRAKE